MRNVQNFEVKLKGLCCTHHIFDSGPRLSVKLFLHVGRMFRRMLPLGTWRSTSRVVPPYQCRYKRSGTHNKKERRKLQRLDRQKRQGKTGNIIPKEKLPVVALVGRPNVGKSRLFNRLVQKKLAIVNDVAGTTRDFRKAVGSVGDISFEVIDTAGLEDTTLALEKEMMDLTREAMSMSNLVLFLIDGISGVTAVDEHFARWMHREAPKVPCILAVNKVDRVHEGEHFDMLMEDCEKLGFGTPVFISGESGHGLGDLYQELIPLENDAGEGNESTDVAADTPTEELALVNVAIVGKPNAGKSTLVNTITNSNRVLTGPMAGVTRDAVRVDWLYKDKTIRLIDTAGIRRLVRASLKSKAVSIEQLSAYEASHALRFAQIVLFMTDATSPPTRDDKALIGQICEEGRGLIILANKCDEMEESAAEMAKEHDIVGITPYNFIKESVEDIINDTIPDARGAPVIPISALTGEGTEEILDEVLRTYDRWNIRVSTGKLNRWLQDVQRYKPPPGRHRIKYGSQTNTRPPMFTFFVRNAGKVPESYVRFLSNLLKEEFDLEGIPIRVLFKES